MCDSCVRVCVGEREGRWYVFNYSCRTDQKLLWNISLSPNNPNNTKEGEGRQNWIFATEAWSKRQHPRAALQQPLCGI